MGENEQGGMLRTVVVVGIVALLAAVIIGSVIGLKAKAFSSIGNTTYKVATAGQTYRFDRQDANGNVSFNGYADTNRNGQWISLPDMDNVPAGQWREVHLSFIPAQTYVATFDINNYDHDRPGGEVKNPETGSINDNDVLRERSVVIMEGSNVLPGTTEVKAGHEYTMIVKWHNGTSRTLYDSGNNVDRSAIVIRTLDKSGGSFKVTDLTGVTYAK